MPLLKKEEPTVSYVQRIDKEMKPHFTEVREQAKHFTDTHAYQYMCWSNVVHKLNLTME